MAFDKTEIDNLQKLAMLQEIGWLVVLSESDRSKCDNVHESDFTKG